MSMKVEIYEDSAGEHRWRMRARNGRLVATSGEGFTRKMACRQSFLNIWSDCASDNITIVELDKDGKETA